MIRLGLLVAVLSGCNQWVRPTPYPADTRNSFEQQLATVSVQSSCDPFDDGGKLHVGSGVMVSDWQVLTAFHVGNCSSSIPTIRVTTADGTWRFAYEKSWPSVDVIRLQLSSADSITPRLVPPAIRDYALTQDEPLYINAGKPSWELIVGGATGDSFGEDLQTFTYGADTQSGNSGAGIYDFEGSLVGIHLGTVGGRKYGARVTQEMIPR